MKNKLLIFIIIFSFTINAGFPLFVVKAEIDKQVSAEQNVVTTTDNDNQDSVSDENIEEKTGDATTIVDLENKVNLNEIEVSNQQADDSEIKNDCLDENCEIKEEDTQNTNKQQDTVEQDEKFTSETDIINDNQATVTDELSGESDSGDNSVETEKNDVDVETGNVNIISNIFNLINVNFIGSDYLARAYNLAGDILGDIDLSRYKAEDLIDKVAENKDFQELIEENKKQSDKEVDDITKINNNNEAEVNNEVVLEGNSGDNSVIGGNDVKIVTGNVSIASNLVNIVNTNVIGNGWTLSFINVLGKWSGDLVLPPLTKMIGKQQNNFSLNCSDEKDCFDDLKNNSILINNDNSADINNQVEINGSSGDNEITDNDGKSDIETGKTLVDSRVYNQVNTNIFDSGWVFGIVNVVGGEWSGNFMSTPENNFSVENTGNYFTYSYHPFLDTQTAEDTNDNTTAESVLDVNDNVDKDNANDTEVLKKSKQVINNNNKATINNIVKILANSGSNTASFGNGSTKIKTGNVTAISNIVNMINNNIIGDNWTLALVNILGSWDGNVQFGKPDLSVTEVAQANPDPAVPEGFIDYNIVMTNKGDAVATKVKLEADFDENLVEPEDIDGGEIIDGKVVWQIDKINIGEFVVKHYRVKIKEEAEDQEKVKNSAIVFALEGDRMKDDNIAHTTVVIQGPSGLQVGFGHQTSSGNEKIEKDNSIYENPVYNNALKITKTNDAGKITYKNQTVNYKIKIYNSSQDDFSDVIVYDDLVDPNNKIINTQTWSLGKVLAGEEITIDYSINFSKKSIPGIYINHVSADGFDNLKRYSLFPKAESKITLSSLESDTAGTYVAIQYYSDSDKILGDQKEDNVVITNLSSDPLPPGQLVIVFDKKVLSLAGETDGSLKFDVPKIEPGKTQTINFNSQAIGLTEGALTKINYLTFGKPVSLLTADYWVREKENTLPLHIDRKNIIKVSTADDKNLSLINSVQASEVNPKVLGYNFHAIEQIPTIYYSWQSFFWHSVNDNIFSLWFWIYLIIVIILLELYNRNKKDKLFDKILGLKIL